MVNERARVQDFGSYVRWDGSVIMPFEKLVQEGLCDCYIGKGGQSGPGLSTQANLQASKMAKVPVNGSFYWVDPCNSTDYDIAHISALIDIEDPDLVVLDIEQWWSDWGKYEGAINKLVTWAEVPHFSPAVLSEHYRQVAQGVKAAYPKKRIIIYTSRAFVLGWAGPMAEWLPEWNGGMVASWPDYGKAIYYLDWDAIRAYPPADYQPDLPPGWTTWSIWQTSSRIRPLEYQGDFGRYDHNYDWGVFNGTVEELKAWAGVEEPVVVPIPERLTLESLDARLKVIEGLEWYKVNVPIVIK